ncbi:MAG: ATP-binding protein [Oscillospiraceae bacterium]
MTELLSLNYEISATDFTLAGEASGNVKSQLKKIGMNHVVVRKVAIAMYEGEINMVIHANGGTAEVKIFDECVEITLKDQGPGIENVEMAMQEGYSTATEKVRELGFGAGMGLPNMKKYADDFEIKSVVGKGTTVFMRINVPND